MKLTNEDVQGILELLDATKFDELHLETERFKLTLRRNKESGDWSQEMQIISAPNVPATLPVANISEAAASAGAATNPSASSNAGWAEIRAHLPGTFYRAARPGAPPFVEIGSYVEENTVVGIIETMKLMNAVHAQARGEIVEICLENAKFAEKSAVLMRIKTEAA
ncbi:MAG: biotin/lipoyl-containing protein [Candidatus Acidiferrum sp.]